MTAPARTYTDTYYGLAPDAPLPVCRVQEITDTPLVKWPDQPELTIGLGTVEDPVGYLRAWGDRLHALADQVEARQPVPFVPAEVTP